MNFIKKKFSINIDVLHPFIFEVFTNYEAIVPHLSLKLLIYFIELMSNKIHHRYH